MVSRGELVEIGDGFRLPDLLESTGARLREVGTTNRTTLADYAAALGPGDRLRAQGAPVELRGPRLHLRPSTCAELAALGAPVVADIGSGLLAPDPLLPDEPDAATALRAGAALVTASGDKLLGGPQAGLLLGRRRAGRAAAPAPAGPRAAGGQADAGRAGGDAARPATPTWRALRAAPSALRDGRAGCAPRSPRPASRPRWWHRGAWSAAAARPGLELASCAVALARRPYAAPLRPGDPPVVGRVERGRLLLDLRCVPPDRTRPSLSAVLRPSR